MMERDRDRDRDRDMMMDDRMDRGEKRGFQKKKGCRFCSDPNLFLDYKDKNLLGSYITERFKIVPRRISGNCAAHQRDLSAAIKRARHCAIIPYTTAQL